MLDGFHRLRHHTVICCHHDDGDVCGFGTACPHGSKGLMTWCINERDLLALAGNLVGTDALSDTAHFVLCDFCFTNRVKQRSFPMVHMAHHRDNGRTDLEYTLFTFDWLSLGNGLRFYNAFQ